ncbi:MAG TPA: hypothetical protein VMY87_06235 [Armatimonadota bacterium]|nr:hypothetical protein [Armatimonadota bacterium]
MAFGDTLNTDTPAEYAERPSLGNDRIREMKRALQERLDVDHYFPADTPGAGQVDDADTGEHRQLTLRERAVPAAVGENKAVMFASEIGGKVGVSIVDEDELVKDVTIQTGGVHVLNLEGKDFTAAAAAITDDLTIDVSGGKLQLKSGDAANGVQAGHLKTGAGDFVDGETLAIGGSGVQVKTGVLGQALQDSGTSNISEATGAWADMADMDVDITTTGGDLLIVASFPCQHGGAAQLLVGGVAKTGTTWAPATTDDKVPVSVQWLETGLAADTYTVKVQWKKLTSYNPLCSCTTWGTKRVLTVVELPHAVS